MPTSLPPASRSPMFVPLKKRITRESGLYLRREAEAESGQAEAESCGRRSQVEGELSCFGAEPPKQPHMGVPGRHVLGTGEAPWCVQVLLGHIPVVLHTLTAGHPVDVIVSWPRGV